MWTKWVTVICFCGQDEIGLVIKATPVRKKKKEKIAILQMMVFDTVAAVAWGVDFFFSMLLYWTYVK